MGTDKKIINVMTKTYKNIQKSQPKCNTQLLTGFEPVTLRLKVRCSKVWAIRTLYNVISNVLIITTHKSKASISLLAQSHQLSDSTTEHYSGVESQCRHGQNNCSNNTGSCTVKEWHHSPITYYVQYHLFSQAPIDLKSGKTVSIVGTRLSGPF